jgi:hypothetical protein
VISRGYEPTTSDLGRWREVSASVTTARASITSRSRRRAALASGAVSYWLWRDARMHNGDMRGSARMEAPARLPQTEDDLADWAVYADWLQTRGDSRGDALAAELALPAAPEREQLAAFHAAVRRLHPRPPSGWRRAA